MLTFGHWFKLYDCHFSGRSLILFSDKKFPVLTWANVWEPLLCGFGVSIVVWAFLFLFEFMMLCMYLLRLFFQTLE